MRRYTFYLSIALLAFGIGSFVGFRFYQNTEKVDPKIGTEILEANEIVESSGEAFKVQTTEDLDDEICSGISQDDIFEPVIKKWLKGKKIKEKLTSPNKDYEDFGEFVPKLLDVNSDGRQELQVKSDCLPGGSCYYFIYQKISGDYKNIFFPMYKIQSIEFGRKDFKGYRKIQAIAKAEDNTKYVVDYIFNGEFYNANKCFEVLDKAGNLMPLDCSGIEEKITR